MAKYRNKLIEIEAFQFTANGLTMEIKEFAQGKIDGPVRSPNENLHFAVHTPKGLVKAYIGDWIIKDADGLLSCCNPDIFAGTYDPVE